MSACSACSQPGSWYSATVQARGDAQPAGLLGPQRGESLVEQRGGVDGVTGPVGDEGAGGGQRGPAGRRSSSDTPTAVSSERRRVADGRLRDAVVVRGAPHAAQGCHRQEEVERGEIGDARRQSHNAGLWVGRTAAASEDFGVAASWARATTRSMPVTGTGGQDGDDPDDQPDVDDQAGRHDRSRAGALQCRAAAVGAGQARTDPDRHVLRPQPRPDTADRRRRVAAARGRDGRSAGRPVAVGSAGALCAPGGRRHSAVCRKRSGRADGRARHPRAAPVGARRHLHGVVGGGEPRRRPDRALRRVDRGHQGDGRGDDPGLGDERGAVAGRSRRPGPGGGPGHIGARSVKWIDRVTARNRPSDNFFQATAYRLLPADHDTDHARVGDGFALSSVALNSAILCPDDGAELSGGPTEVAGYAFAGGDRHVSRVDVSADGGTTWAQAELDGQDGPWTWQLWHATVDLPDGATSTITARAWDTSAALQPRDPADLWNPKATSTTPGPRTKTRSRTTASPRQRTHLPRLGEVVAVVARRGRGRGAARARVPAAGGAHDHRRPVGSARRAQRLRRCPALAPGRDRDAAGRAAAPAAGSVGAGRGAGPARPRRPRTGHRQGRERVSGPVGPRFRADGLQAERTGLAWSRTALGALANAVLLAVNEVRAVGPGLAVIPAGLAVALGLTMILVGRHRDSVLRQRPLPPSLAPARLVPVIGGCVVVLVVLAAGVVLL
ncbi:hypothetical protein L7F22_010006 [Adiantum nelumboides]|nr:hypothetical protein [Adiantum nelumboides]